MAFPRQSGRRCPTTPRWRDPWPSFFMVSTALTAANEGVGIITTEESSDKGVQTIMAEARAIVADIPTYASFDIDGIDPPYAPGTGTPGI